MLREILNEVKDKPFGVEETRVLEGPDLVVLQTDRRAKAGPNAQRARSYMERKGFEKDRVVDHSENDDIPRGTELAYFEPEPSEMNQNRSAEARASDRGKDANVTDDRLEWASDPSRHDFPGVDTGPRFEESFDGDFEDFDDSEFSF